ncbi:MAG: PDZ domain-containing protein, partial [Proteobacteria bacterium]|nr:PDZ domain-containing protein [Pseudomonadota bacterium]
MSDGSVEGVDYKMRSVLIAAGLVVLLLAGCSQPGPKVAENVIHQVQVSDQNSVNAMLEQARTFRKANPELFGEAGGVLITGLVPGGQGEKIGLKPGDILLTYDGSPLQAADQLIQLTNKKDAQTSVTLTYEREGKKHDAVLQGGRIGIQISSLVPNQSEEINQIIEQGNQAYYQSRFQDALQLYRQALVLTPVEN